MGADGKPKRVKGYKNKAKTQTLAAKLEAEAANGPNPFDAHRRTALTDHLNAYKQHLTAKNDDLDHVKQTCSAIGKVLDGCGFKVFDDLQVSSCRELDCRHSGNARTLESGRPTTIPRRSRRS